MTQRIFNFSAGPACLPESVLEEARENLLSLGSTGIGILEHSHRGKAYLAVHEEAVSLIRELGQVPDSHEVLFLTGGASLQFSMIPLNLLSPGETADYLVTGMWSQKAVVEARRVAHVHEACSSADRNFCYIPTNCQYSPQPRYVHFTSNNTIFGTQFPHEPTPPAGVPLVCDASSDIFSRPLDVSKYGVIYAGAQKNLGPSGVTVVIIRKDLVAQGPKDLATMLQYRTHADENSLYNTPPTFGIYVLGLMLKWLKSQGGLAAMARRKQALPSSASPSSWRTLPSWVSRPGSSGLWLRAWRNSASASSSLPWERSATARLASRRGSSGHRSSARWRWPMAAARSPRSRQRVPRLEWAQGWDEPSLTRARNSLSACSCRPCWRSWVA